MAIPGQRFELDLDADDFTINPIDESSLTEAFRIKDIQEHDSSDIVAPPNLKPSSTGFPEHKQRKVSRFKQRQEPSLQNVAQRPSPRGPSDAAIAHRLSQKHGVDAESLRKAEIGQENDRRLAAMSAEEIVDARAEIMGTLSPALIERLLKRSRIDDEEPTSPIKSTPSSAESRASDVLAEPVKEKEVTFSENNTSTTSGTSGPQPEPPSPQPSPADNNPQKNPPNTNTVHFPAPPRSPSAYRPLDPSSPNFLTDLKTTYFPELMHQPSPTSLSWLQPPDPTHPSDASYSPSLTSLPASSIRFSFTGTLIPPSQSLSLPAHLGLHHHGLAPESAGYTIPELTLLARSTLPNQRCLAYQTLGRILYRLGKEEFGSKGTDLYEGLWEVVEKERTLEMVMAEAGDGEGEKGRKGHVSARAYATEALWLWRKGNGGERGLRRKEVEGRWEEGVAF